MYQALILTCKAEPYFAKALPCLLHHPLQIQRFHLYGKFHWLADETICILSTVQNKKKKQYYIVKCIEWDTTTSKQMKKSSFV